MSGKSCESRRDVGSASALRRIAVRALILVAAIGPAILSVSAPVAQEMDKKAALLDAMRLLGTVETRPERSARDSFLAPTPPQTVDEATFERAISSGAKEVRGLMARAGVMNEPGFDPYFEGKWKRIHHPYMGQDIFTYDSGVYAIPKTAAYVGTFSYFPGPMESWESYPKGAIAVVGKKITPDGKAETGIFIDERVIAGFGLNFVKATPDYLDDFARRNAAAVENYRRQQVAEADSGFSFGQFLALGLGAAMIGTSGLPDADKLQIGQAFVSDVMGAGDGKALFDTMVANMPASGGSLFDGGAGFMAPGLDGMLADIAGGSAGAAGAGGGGTAQQAAAARSETYSFTCPTGQSYSIPVSFKSPACGAAMKNFARVFSCNLIDDMGSAQSRCQQACGNAQCAE